MSGLLNKVKEAVTGGSHHDTTNTSGTSSTGTHNTTGSNLQNKLDPDHNGKLGNQHSTGTGSGLQNKLDPDHNGKLGNQHSTGTGSSLQNKLDPDHDGRLGNQHHTGTTGTGLTGSHQGQYAGTGSGMTGGLTGSTGQHNTSGPHNSDMMNRADPRVDSDRDGSRNYGAAGLTGGSHQGQHTGTGLTGSTGTGYGSSNTGSGLTGGMTGSTGQHNSSGPHNSDMLNRADPRVDSDRDGRRGIEGSHSTGAGYGSSTTGGTGDYTSTGLDHGSHRGISGASGETHFGGIDGPHPTATANALDPHVNATTHHTGHHHQHGTTGTGLTGSNEYGSTGQSGYGATGQQGYGSTNQTGSTGSGPVHNSNLLNKIDPRVDSNNDGQKGLMK